MTTSTLTLGALTQSPAFEFALSVQQPLPVKPKACVVLLHGAGGSETNLADLAGAMDADTLVVLARGPLQFAPGQFGWFRVNFTASGPSIVAAQTEQSR
ncbi:MAG: phospholipase/Carboxylesterase [Polaromonas sp.]|nr:phospholipase/Carboxylesterase [Polaromonas sp.]